MADPNTPTDIPELAALRAQPKAFSIKPPPELVGLQTQIGGGVPGVTEDYAAARARLKKPTDVSSEQAKLLQQQGRLEQDIGIAQQAKEQYQAEAAADIATQQREAAQRIEDNLDAVRAKLPYKEFHPTKDNIQSLSTLFGLIGVIGASLGGAGKMSATASLNAMGGMMKGWQQGRADLWKKEKEEFDKGMQQVKAVLEDAYKDADRAMKTLAYNRQEAEALATQSAAKLGGQVGKQILAKQGVERYFTFLDGVKKDLTEAEKRAFEREKFGAEQEYRRKQLELEREKITAQKSTNLLLKIDPAIRNKLGEYPNYDVNRLIGIPTKSQTQVVESFESLNSIEDIGQFVRSNPDAVGLLAEIANRSNLNTLDSFQTWEAQVNSNPNLPESAKLLNKMLTSQAYRDVSATGQRPTVYLDRVFKDLYSQNSSPTALLSILKQREKEANNILSRYDLDIEKNANAARFELHKTEPREYMKSAKFVTPSGQEVSAIDVEETAKKRKKNFATVVRELGLKPAPQPAPVGGQ